MKTQGILLPSISLSSVEDGSILNTDQLEGGHPFVIVYFDPDCRHCQEVTEDVLARMEEFEDTKLYYVSDVALDRLKVFDHYFKLNQYPKIVLLHDPESKLKKFFHPRGIPYLGFFDSKKKLQVIYDGGTGADTILHELAMLQ